MTSLEGALCVGEWELFDSRHPEDHKLAAAICNECPVRAACADLYQTTHDAAYASYGPTGTWAGTLHGTLIPHAERTATEDAMFSPEEALAAHAAYVRGDRDDRAIIGNRVWERARSRRRRNTDAPKPLLFRDSIDEAVVLRVVNGEPKPRTLTHAESKECVNRLRAMGLNNNQIAKQYGFKPGRYPEMEAAS